MESDVHANQLAPLGIDVSIPEPADRTEIDRIIMDELVYGQFTPPSIGTIRDIISDMKELGCDAVILGCTELPLVINETNSPLPVLDSTRLLARAALAHAIQAGD